MHLMCLTTKKVEPIINIISKQALIKTLWTQ